MRAPQLFASLVGLSALALSGSHVAAQTRISVYSAGPANLIDNLAKGAAGQAVQCMNVAFGLSEGLGLDPRPIAATESGVTR